MCEADSGSLELRSLLVGDKEGQTGRNYRCISTATGSRTVGVRVGIGWDFRQAGRSTSIYEGTREQIDRYLMVIGRSGSKSRQIGSALVLTGGIQTTEADHQIAQSG